MGDRRSGSELLLDAPADSLQTVAAMAASRRGRAALTRLARRVEQQLAALEPPGQWDVSERAAAWAAYMDTFRCSEAPRPWRY